MYMFKLSSLFANINDKLDTYLYLREYRKIAEADIKMEKYT